MKAGVSVAVTLRSAGLLIKPPSIYKARRADPVFAARVGEFWAPRLIIAGQRRIDREERRAERLRQAERRRVTALARSESHRFKEQFTAALRSDEIYAAVNAAVPKGMMPDMRDDIISDLVVGLLDGDFAVADLPQQVAQARTAYNRMFGGYAPSLDAPIGEGGFTLGNSLVASYI